MYRNVHLVVSNSINLRSELSASCAPHEIKMEGIVFEHPGSHTDHIMSEHSMGVGAGVKGQDENSQVIIILMPINYTIV